MSRCVYDGVFYRVFFIILLAVAFTFTVILTNVFVDIDGLLANEERGKQNEHDIPATQETPVEQKTEPTVFVLPANVAEVRRDFDVEEKQETANDVKTFEDEEDASYRTKRSLGNSEEAEAVALLKDMAGQLNTIGCHRTVAADTTNFQFHIKDPKIKNILTNRLATLLEELDNEETNNNKLDNTTPKDIAFKLDASKPLKDIIIGTKSIVNDKIENDKKEKELLHLTMHNILLQGIIGHMDLNDIYKKVHNLVQNMDAEGKTFEKDKELQKLLVKSEEQTKDSADIENMFLEELVKCAKLQKQIVEKNNHKSTEKPPAVQKVPKMLIKTVIDISSLRNKENETSPKEIRGVIKFLYNGKAVKFKQADDKDYESSETQIPHIMTNNKNANKFLEAIEVSDFIKDNIHIPNSIINNAIADYFSKNAEIANLFKNTSMKRSKRNVNIKKPHDQHTTDKIKIKSKNDKNQDEDLYVEIETHFDGKGIQGEKKRKLIKSIIQKIQKAIRSDMKNMHEKKMPKKYHLKKRFQAPLDNRERILIDKFLIPFDAVVKRELTPISKTYPVNAEAPYFHDKSGETWKGMLFGPRFLSSSKGINSAELGQVDVHYEKEHAGNMISPRMQKPLNDDAVDGDMNNFYELGNLKFYIKDLDGSGFSIGFNQFVGEAPDDESINTFTGVESLLKSYRSKYDDGEGKPVVLKRNVKFVEKDNIGSAEEIGEEFSNDDESINEHNIKRRNVDPDNQDHHSNEYKIIFSNNFLPYDSYQEVIEDRDKKISVSLQKDNSTSTNKKILLIGKTIDKALKPSEIFSLADLIGKRKKRSLKVKKYSRVNIGSKMNKFFHTNSKVIRTIYLKNGLRKDNKRNKRQVEKIRIVATDNSGNMPIPRSSDENIFLVSDENLFSDHAVIREVPEEAVEAFERPNEEYAVPAVTYEEEKPHHHASDFNGKARHNILMSKYPHVFMEEIGRSKEEESGTPENVFSKYYDAQNYYEPPKTEYHQAYKRIVYASTENPDNANNVQEIVDAISPRTNYKLTVKILPKNATSGVNEGFKEVHTSINKSVSKNGLIISSQVNVSEFSKVEKINKNDSSESATDPPSTTLPPFVKHIRNQQDKMNQMLKQHKLRIEEQLEHLNKERQTIDTYMGAKSKEPLISVWLQTIPPQKLHLTKDEAGQLITSALLKLRDAPHLNELSSPQERFPFMNPSMDMLAPPMVPPIPQPIASPIAPPMPPPMALPMPPPPPPPPLPSPSPTPSSPPTTTPSSPPPPPPTQPRQDLEKIRLVNTILHNENLTNTILTKIDKNTRTLQAFLQKLTERLESDKVLKRNEEVLKKNEDHRFKPNNVYSKDYGPFVHKPYNAPNADLDKNDTRHVSIPFVYAYQQSFPSNKANIPVPVASIVYQGHIHANAVTSNELLKHHPKSHAKIHFTNDSRFFIDDLESEVNKASPMKREDLGDLTIFSDKTPLMKIPLRNVTGV